MSIFGYERLPSTTSDLDLSAKMSEKCFHLASIKFEQWRCRIICELSHQREFAYGRGIMERNFE